MKFNNNHGIYIDRHENSLFLNGEWEYNLFDDDKSIDFNNLKYKTNLPSSAYKSVYESGILPDYYYSDNSKLYVDMRNKVMCYRRTFETPKNINGKMAFLCFDAADYTTVVYLNGKYLGEHIGITAGPYINVTDILRKNKENEIKIIAKAPSYKVKNFDAHNRKGENTQLIGWAFTGDAECSTGHFCVQGITGDIRIEFVEPVHLSRPFMYTNSVTDKKAKLHLSVELTRNNFDETKMNRGYYNGEEFNFSPNTGITKHSTGKKYQLVVKMTDEDGNVLNNEYVISETDFTKSGIDKDRHETQYIEKDIEVKNPKLWYPYSMGNPHLYKTEISLYDGEKLLDSHTFNYGIRTVTAEYSKSEKFFYDLKKFQFVVNGEKIFLRGVNWMPFDFMYDETPDRYERIIRILKECNISFIRLWGAGGKYEENIFYDLCDKNGIMVWQDTIISNMITPKWDVRLFDTLISANIYRIRNHPSLVVYCGGNEFNCYHVGNAAILGRFFQTTRNLDPTRIVYDTTCMGGSVHSYQNIEPSCYRTIYKDVPLMAETGIHSFPHVNSMSKSFSDKDLEGKVDDFSVEFQRKHPELMNHFLENNEDRVPQMLLRITQLIDTENCSIKDLCFGTQYSAYEIFQFMCEALTENYPKTAGLIPWVFTRPWNSMGAQIVDHYEYPLLHYYALKKGFSDVNCMLSLKYLTYGAGEKVNLKAVVINHKKKEYNNLDLKVKVYSPELNVDFEATKKVSIKGYKTNVMFDSFEIPKKYLNNFFFMTVSLKGEGIDVHQYYRPKCLEEYNDKKYRDSIRGKIENNIDYSNRTNLSTQVGKCKTSLKVKRTKANGEYFDLIIKNTGKKPAFPVIIDGEKEPIYLSDNAFMLEEGEERTIKVRFVKEEKVKIYGFNFDEVIC